MKQWIILASLLAALAVGLGAFGAHALKARLSQEMLVIWETGVRYHFYHALGLLGVAFAASKWEHGAITASGWLMVVGVLIFSGSLYALSLSGIKILGAITPIGGACMIAAWICLAYAAFKS